MKYKVKQLLNGVQNLDDSMDLGVEECANAQEAEALVERMHRQGLVFRTKRKVGDWGVELFFDRR
jgi:muconolactone delta-isomerase